MTDLIICPHCGRVVNLNDPRLLRLTQSQFAVWHSIERNARARPLGVTEIADLAGVAPTTASYHVKKLRGAGLLKAIPKRKGGSYKVYVAAA